MGGRDPRSLTREQTCLIPHHTLPAELTPHASALLSPIVFVVGFFFNEDATITPQPAPPPAIPQNELQTTGLDFEGGGADNEQADAVLTQALVSHIII